MIKNKTLFNGFSEGREIEMPIADGPFGSYFGMFGDQPGCAGHNTVRNGTGIKRSGTWPLSYKKEDVIALTINNLSQSKSIFV